MPFQIQARRVSYHLRGDFVLGDLLRLNEVLADLRPQQVERVWELLYTRHGSAVEAQLLTLEQLADLVFNSSDALRMYATLRLMHSYGQVFFSSSGGGGAASGGGRTYAPLRPSVVQDNLRDRAALREFKNKFVKLSSPPALSASATEIPERVTAVLNQYVEGLCQLVARVHPWTASGLGRVRFNESEVARARELLDFLALRASAKNAKKVLEVMGVWYAACA